MRHKGHNICTEQWVLEPEAAIPQEATATPSVQTDQRRIDAARKFAVDLAKLAANTRCTNVAILDVRGVSPVTDFFVLATGTSPRQMRTVTDDAGEFGAENNFKPIAQSGAEGETWMLIDFVDVVMHVFNAQARAFYDLDSLWGDAPRVEWNDAPAPAASPTSAETSPS